ncbi:Low-affinity iron/zinc ion transport protein fet4 [Golovinomyces cichoracearum]|uniref:Low-affinity iron/zinc ion transport protein fet4 n=1 Tax=Golovinomyces cichoracearum TaxID=62708 RepID=A0A420HGB8_9PEZI|nr:Low-affinity iron/zinc ion transport protein fet4 [Golovinomyces cichoracearum]
MSFIYFKNIKNSIFPERTAFFAAAKIQDLTEEEVRSAPYSRTQDPEKDNYYKNEEVSGPADTSSFRKANCFDKITVLAGSSVTFIITLLLVALWAAFGILLGPTDTWQIVFQNASSIQVYVIDILLIRQQQNASRVLMTLLAEFNSRRTTLERLLDDIPGCDEISTHEEKPRALIINGKPFDEKTDESIFIPKVETSAMSSIWGQSCQVIARALGSMLTFLLYWIGIGVWAALGPSLKFSDTWQLYINSATAIALTFTSVFLQNSQQREEERLTRCLQHTLKIDAGIEHQLRVLTGDRRPNPIFTIPDIKRTHTERFNDVTADIMGSGVGVVLSLVFVVIWVSVGPLMKFNDNWWLIIGSFTGLVGFVNGFVLRSLYYREEEMVKDQFQKLAESDRNLLARLNVPISIPTEPPKSLMERFSLAISDACGHRFTPPGSMMVVIGLLLVATAMSWSVTGQLLCNTPTMIIEGFLLIILIHAHNHANYERDVDFSGLLKRRLLLHGFVETIE